MKIIVSTCGTSVLKIGQSEDVRTFELEQRLVRLHTNDKEQVPALKALLQRTKSKLLKTSNLSEVANASAELNAIVKYYKHDFSANTNDIHYLICTDTWLGKSVAEIIREFLAQKGYLVNILHIDGLQTANFKLFKRSIFSLIDEIENLRKCFYSSKIIYNLTGGFKSVIGFLNTLALIYADEVIYVFEQSNELIRIPKFPVDINFEQEVEKDLDNWRRLSLGKEPTKTHKINEIAIDSEAGMTDLTPLGKVIWNKASDTIYKRYVLPSPCEEVVFGKYFLSSVKDLNPKRFYEINKKIDLLIRHLYVTRDTNLQSLDFKKLKGNPSQPSTHECDAWHDGDARRLFGHFEGRVFVLDKLDKGLGH